MKKFKKIISIGLAAMMVLSVMSVGVSAAEFIDADGIAHETTPVCEMENFADMIDIAGVELLPVISENAITPLGYPVPTRTAYFWANTEWRSFVIPSSEPNFKVWVNNLSADLGAPSTYTVEIFNANGLALPSFTVDAGGDATAQSRVYNGYGAGTYYVCITNADGHESVKGEITIRSSYSAINN